MEKNVTQAAHLDEAKHELQLAAVKWAKIGFEIARKA